MNMSHVMVSISGVISTQSVGGSFRTGGACDRELRRHCRKRAIRYSMEKRYSPCQESACAAFKLDYPA